jgi:hypothetical protein
MLEKLKALVVVLSIAWVMFALAKPICLRYTAPADFSLRRNVWFILTIAAFASPSFWLYVAVALPVCLWAARRDSNPLALYFVLLLVIPPMQIEIPTIGINRLFDLTQERLLGLTILLPMAFAVVRTADKREGLRFTTVDGLLLAYGLLQLVLLMAYESPTNTLRRAFLFTLDTYLVYFVFSRMVERRAAAADIMVSLCLVGAVLAPLAVFETSKQWLLYTGISEAWGARNAYAWIFRGDALRAQVSTGHSIALGLTLAMAIGAWLYLRAAEASRFRRAMVFVVFGAGLIVSYSRGPWLMAVLLVFAYLALSSRNFAAFAKSSLMIAAVGAIVLITPFGSGIVEKLPFIGSVGQETIEYRSQVAETSWQLIQQNPLLGNPFVLLEMENLRQGQGIIDLVNGYAIVALFYGLIGLALYVGALGIPVRRALKHLRVARSLGDDDLVSLGASLIACMFGTLFFIATAGPSLFQWALIGMLMGYARMRPAPVDAFEEAPPQGVKAPRRPAVAF